MSLTSMRIPSLTPWSGEDPPIEGRIWLYRAFGAPGRPRLGWGAPPGPGDISGPGPGPGIPRKMSQGVRSCTAVPKSLPILISRGTETNQKIHLLKAPRGLKYRDQSHILCWEGVLGHSEGSGGVSEVT
jgi:hypothetical protein